MTRQRSTRTLRELLRNGLFIDGDWVESKDQDPSGTIRLTQLADVGETLWRDRSDRWMNEEQARRLRITYLHPGDVLVARMPDPLGRACLVPETIGRAATVVDVAVLRPSPQSIDSRYLMYAINSRPVRSQIELLQAGATRQRVSRKNLGGVRVPFVPADEQHAIADYLDHETAGLDALVAKQEEFIELLRERRLSEVSDSLARLGPPNTQLRRVAYIQTGVTLSGEGDTSHPSWPYLRVANVQMGRVDLSHVKEIRLSARDAAGSMLRAGDVLMTEGGDIDKLGRGTVWDGCISPMVHQNHVFAVRAEPGRLVPHYLAWWLDSSIAREYFYLTAKKTTNLASTNKTVVGRLPIHVPDLNEQQVTVAQIVERTNRIDALMAKASQHIALAKERRSALITAAVTGQIDVRTAASQKAS